MSRPFVFGGTWTVDHPLPLVRAVLVDLERYPEWWPEVLAVAKLTDDSARVLCRSTLPYTLDLLLTATRREGEVLETALSGDLDGWVRWTLTSVDGGTRLDLAQQVTVSGRALGAASYVVRPVLRWNHHRMMAGCLAGLEARLG